MIKQELNVEDFKELFSKGLSGLYVFIIHDCTLCFEHLDKMAEIDFLQYNKVYVVNCLDDIKYYMNEHNLDDMPQTRVYKNNEIVFDKGGVFFNLQYKELKEVLN